jgi:hypothetical protein
MNKLKQILIELLSKILCKLSDDASRYYTYLKDEYDHTYNGIMPDNIKDCKIEVRTFMLITNKDETKKREAIKWLNEY